MDLEPQKAKVLFFRLLAKMFGITFAVKLMEKGEEGAQSAYQQVSDQLDKVEDIVRDEYRHEKQLLELIDEERLHYVGSIVLGLNDALVELTGALAGFTFALRDPRLVALTGLVTGTAASLSMGASEYLSTKSEGEEKTAAKAASYTTAAYVITVVLLIFPFLVLSNPYVSLLWSIGNAILVILVFTYYISVARDLPFRKRFTEMAGISLGVAAFTFVIGYMIRIVLGVEV